MAVFKVCKILSHSILLLLLALLAFNLPPSFCAAAAVWCGLARSHGCGCCVFVAALCCPLVQIPSDFDIVYIGSCLGRHGYSYTRGFVAEINPHIYLMNHHRCASGYILSRKGVETLLHAPPMMGMDNIDEWMQFQMSEDHAFKRVYWLEPVLSYEGTKSFLFPAFCSPRTSWLGCDPLWRPVFQSLLAMLVLAACVLSILVCRSHLVWQARAKRCAALCGRGEVRYSAVPLHSPRV